MNAPSGMRRPSMERAFREALNDPKSRGAVRDRMGWDDSQVSRFLSGQMGLTIDKIDTAIAVLSLRVTSRRYLEAIAVLGITGANCHCAREGMGECGFLDD